MIALLAAVALAGPWAPEPGHGYLKGWVTGLPGIGYVTGDGRVKHGAYGQVYASTYAEVGVIPGRGAAGRTALTFHGDLLRLIVADDSQRTRAFASTGDPQLGVRVQAFQAGRWAVGVEGGARAPLAPGDVKARVRDEDLAPVAAVRMGAGVWEASALVSAGFGTDTWYGAASAGWTFRFSGFQDALLFSIEAGRPFGRWSTRGRVTGHVALGPTTVIAQDTTTGSGNGATWTGFSAEVDRRLSDHVALGGSLEGGFYVKALEAGPVLSVYLATWW